MAICQKTRLFVEKKEGFRVEALELLHELNRNLHLNLSSLRLINIYDLFNIDSELLEKSKRQVFSEPVTDTLFDRFDHQNHCCFAIELQDGQFDQRADSAMQCLGLIDPDNEALVKSARLLVFEENLSDEVLNRIKKYCINEVEAKEKNMNILDHTENIHVEEIPIHHGFINFSPEKVAQFREKLQLAMSFEDLLFVQRYFKEEERRDPSDTEIRVLDTYWSDHCRHTTFETELKNITFTPSQFEDQMQDAFNQYLELRENVHQSKKPMTLMDMATICGKHERKIGNLDDMEISEEVNACSVYIDVDVDGKTEQWLLMFKNETHNHPTEIEPFGGASTCVGGAIRDPLSGRSYVYQALRVTGAADITEPIENTIEGKLPQQVISKTAAQGYSSYGNQIGLAATHVREIYHEGYKAKRMEIGAVVGAVPAHYVRRETPSPGDVVIMFGGRTGRDGIGGATGSSKEHTTESLEVSAAEVQKGNAPEERKIQRLFRKPHVTKLIKKSNDFGAGGVSVAIGELADGLEIDLNAVKTKYKGLNGTEIAISESQERMSVVVAPEDQELFMSYCAEENIEAVVIAKVTDTNRLLINWNGYPIVNLCRDFINSSGVRQQADVTVNPIQENFMEPLPVKGDTLAEQVYERLGDLNVASQKGMIEMFDSTIGASTVLMPFGGKHQLTETQASVQKIPVRNGVTSTCSIMSYGYNPFISERSPFHGAQLAILESMAKIVAVGGDYSNIRFTFQEYFEKLGNTPEKWGKPFAALLGAIRIQNQFHLPSIGGKDSMSGTFHDLNVPPTLVSFAITTGNAAHIISPQFKDINNKIYIIGGKVVQNGVVNVEQAKLVFSFVHEQVIQKRIVSAFAVQMGGIVEALAKMSFGNDLGFNITTEEDLFGYRYGSFVVESTETLDFPDAVLLGTVDHQWRINQQPIDKKKALQAWRKTFASIYPETVPAMDHDKVLVKQEYHKPITYQPYPSKTEKVKVLIPVFPGTNCDYDTARAFEQAGAETKLLIFKNLTSKDIQESIEQLALSIDQSHILALSGGFSSGDEPDGSGKFIANVLNNEKIKAAIERHLTKKHLIIGICNGFQALIKSGLLPGGKLGDLSENSPTLYRNDINRHISHIAQTVVTSNNSPWLSSFKPGEIHKVALSHGEGKLVVSDQQAQEWFDKGQVAFQYCNDLGEPTMDTPFNPNGSHFAIEGIVSPCGLILGKMGHSERAGKDIFKNIEGNHNQPIFKNGVNYFLEK